MPNAHCFPKRHLAHVLRSSSNFRPSYFLVKQPNTIMSRIIHTSASLKSANALPISTLQGKVDSSLMEGLDGMGFEYMTPVQSQVMNGLPTFRSDWYALLIFQLQTVHSF